MGFMVINHETGEVWEFAADSDVDAAETVFIESDAANNVTVYLMGDGERIMETEHMFARKDFKDRWHVYFINGYGEIESATFTAHLYDNPFKIARNWATTQGAKMFGYEVYLYSVGQDTERRIM